MPRADSESDFARRRAPRPRPRAPGLGAAGVVLAVVTVVSLVLLGMAVTPSLQPEVALTPLELEIQRYEEAWPAPTQSADEYVDNATARLERRIDLEGAEINLQKALVVQPDHRDALLLLIELSGASQGRWGPPIPLAEELLAGSLGEGWESNHARAALHLGRGDPVLASQAHRRAPLEVARVRRLRMEIELELGRHDEADQHAAVLQGLWPDDSGACHARARRMLTEGRLAQAEEELMACVVAGARDSGLYEELGRIADATGRWEEALELYRQAGDGAAVAFIVLQEQGLAARTEGMGQGTQSSVHAAWLDLREQRPQTVLDQTGTGRPFHLVRMAAQVELRQCPVQGEGPAELLLAARCGGSWAAATGADPTNPWVWKQRLGEDPDLASAVAELEQVEVAAWLLRGPPADRSVHWALLAPARWDDVLARTDHPMARLMAGEALPADAPARYRAAERLIAEDPSGALAAGPTGPLLGLAQVAAGRTEPAHAEAVKHRDDPLWIAVLALTTSARGNDEAALSLLNLALEQHPEWTGLNVERYAVSLRLQQQAPAAP